MAKAEKKESGAAVVKPASFVTLLLDESGSMGDIKNETIEGFNTYLAALQAEKDADIRFSFLLFDSNRFEKRFVAEPVAKIPMLTHGTFTPGASTPLIDAAYKTIRAVEEAVVKQASHIKVVICIQTDGMENSSREYNWARLAELVKAKQADGWQFNFMGAGIDAYHQAALMGVSRENTVSYGTDVKATRAVFMATANNASGFAAGRSSATAYSGVQKIDAGDKE